MRRHLSAILIAIFGLAVVPASLELLPRQQTVLERKRVNAHPETLPLAFERNAGQAGPNVDFFTRGNGYNLFLTSGEAVLALKNPSAHTDQSPSIVRMKLVGGKSNPEGRGLEELSGKANYFIGSDPKEWRTNISTYARVQYTEVYPGVDLIYYGSGRLLEYDFVVAPGISPDVIALAFEGANTTGIDDSGNLAIETNGGRLHLHKPFIYQETERVRTEVEGHYVRRSNDEIGFEIRGYDAAKPLIIDPVLNYSTYLGGSDVDGGFAITVDSTGAAYLTGVTSSINFPTMQPLQGRFGGGQGGDRGDAFVAKLKPDGSGLVYATYFGGLDVDAGSAISTDAEGNAYVSGATNSVDFPTRNAFQSRAPGSFDAFVAKIDSTGSVLIYSTYLGGSQFDRTDGIAVDAQGNAYVTGRSLSGDFPLMDAFQQSGLGAFVTKIAPAGTSLVYSTFLPSAFEGWGIAVDSSGKAFITALGAAFDVVVTKLNAAGSRLEYTTSLGASRYDYYFNRGRIAVDGAGNAYVTGYVEPGDRFVATNALQPVIRGSSDAFVAKLNPAGTRIYSTFLGGSGGEEGLGITADQDGNAYVTGWTFSQDFPSVNPLYPATPGSRGFVTKLNASGSAIVFSSYMPGVLQSMAIAVDAIGDLYLTGYAGSGGFPLVNALQPSYGGGEVDAFVTKVGFSTRASQIGFTTTDRGGESRIANALGPVGVGYSRVLPSAGDSAPSGVAIFGFRQNGVLVSEVGVPASPLLSSGRIYVDIGNSANTGMALASTHSQAVTVNFVFTNEAGEDSGQAAVAIPANGQIAHFLNEPPFNAPQSFRGTLTFNASAPIGVTALRGLTNERAEFLVTTLPVVELPKGGADALLIPHFADGGGWATTVILVNPTDAPLAGNIEFFGQGNQFGSAQPVDVTIGGTQGSRFSYRLLPRSAVRLQTAAGASTGTVVGSVRVLPEANNPAPAAFGVFAFRNAGVTVSEASIPAQHPGSAYRMYVESSNSSNAGGAIQSGIAVANTSTSPATVTFELTTLSGNPTGLQGSVTIPAQGQVATFLHEISGFQSLPPQFQGILRITTDGPGIALAGLRGRYNERDDFLITTTSPVDENASASNGEIVFPHFAVGGGYTTQFVVFSGVKGQSSKGTLQFLNQSGETLNLNLR